MRRCTFCGAELPPQARFCGACGQVMDADSSGDMATTMGNTPPPPPPPPISSPGWPAGGGQVPTAYPAFSNTPPYPPSTVYPTQLATPGNQPASSEDEEERRKNMPPWLPYAGGALAAGSAEMYAPYSPGAPMAQGTPSMGSVPGVQGTPQMAPSGNPAVGQPYAQAGNPAAGQPYAQVGGHASAPAPSQAPYQPITPGTHPGYQHPDQPLHPNHPLHHLHNQHPQPEQPVHIEHQVPQRTPSGDLHEGHAHHHHEHAAHHMPAVATKAAGTGLSIKTVVIAITIIVVVAGGGIGAAAYFLTRPHPVITASSSFSVGSTLAGANGTTLHISGQKFSGSSPITFLLDGTPLPGSQSVTSDPNGNFQADLKITPGWKVGTHTLTARDASNNSTQQSVTIVIVSPGQAHTPGPNGAPPDSATFKVSATLQTRFSDGTSYDPAQTLQVTGHPDPTGGTVCRTQDNGTPVVTTSSTFDTSTAYRDSSTYSCTGTYKGGQLTYTETITSELVTYYNANPVQTCKLLNPHAIEQISGNYTTQGVFSGSANFEQVPQTDFSCSAQGAYFYYRPAQGTWSGQVTNLQK